MGRSDESGRDAGAPDFLSGGGAMGALIRAHDWASTSLGPVASWPQSLRTAVAAILRSPVPIVTLWGEDGVMIYNDAYSGFAGGRHPQLLGSKVREGWPEVADFNDHVMKTGLAGGTLSYKDQELTLHRHGRPEQVWLNLDYSPVLDEHGKPAGVIAIVIETTEQVLAARRLRESEERLRLVIDSARDYAIFTTDPERRITSWSQGAAAVFGYSAEDAVGRSADMLWTPGDRAAGQPEHETETALKEGCANDERWHQRSDGGRVFLNGSVHSLPPDPQGRERGVIKIARDETRRRTIQAALKDSETRLRAVLDSAPGGFYCVDPDGNTTLASRGFIDMLGFPSEDGVVGRKLHDLIHHHHPDGTPYPVEDCPIYRCASTGAPAHVPDELFFRYDNGAPVPVEYWASPIVRDGEHIGAICTIVELTERKRAEAALRESEERLQFALEAAAGVGTWDWDVVNDRVVANASFARLYGVDPKRAAAGAPIAEFTANIHPDDAERVQAEIEAAMASGDPFVSEYRLQATNGSVNWVSARGRCKLDGDGQPLRFSGVTSDITERRSTEDALRESEERFRDLADNMPTLCWWADATGYIFWYNRRWYEYTGTEPGDMKGWGWQAVHDPNCLPEVMQRWPDSIASGEPFEMTFPLKGADGAFRTFLTRAVPLRDESGAIVRWFGTNTDVSEQREVEEALRDSEARLQKVNAEQQAILSQLAEGVIVTDPAGRIIFVNEAAKQLHGVEALDVEPSEYAETYHLFREDGSPHPFEELPLARAVIGGETVIDARWRIRRPDGTEVLAIGSAQPISDAANDRLGSVLTVRDDTSRFAAEEALREAEERYRLSARATNDAIWDWDLSRNHVLWNEALCANFGYRTDDVEPTGEWWIEHIHPDDRERIGDSIHAVIDGDGQRWQDEYRFRAADGSYRSVLDRGFVSRDEQGTAVRMIGAMQDQTERQAAEAALREETQTLETLNEVTADVAAELDIDRAVQIVTDAGVALTGAQIGAFFYNVVNNAGESYMLYAISGVDRAEFDKFPMPRKTAIFAHTFDGVGPVRSDDITRDPRYGLSDTHHGMPKEHLPVRSYLAVSVISRSGEVIGGLFFGHPEEGRFTERHERLITGVAAQAAIAIDNARLFQKSQAELDERVRAEERLRELNATLEQRVAEEVEQRSAAEEQLRQMQKMETLGQLTGGVAHDFNNLLQIVTGNLEILQRNLPEDQARLRRSAENAMRGAERAAVLTQRLLAFARRQPLEPKPISLNKLVAGMSELLHRTLGETYEVETVLASGLWSVEADPNQLENAIINLAVNARDAMPGGGKLTIETSNTNLDHGYAAQNTGVTPGQYVVVCISDTGTGIDADTLERVFEPFFTTKDVGRGTGLGLSMVYGFVKQSGGHVKIYSEPGQGTTVKLYLPRRMGTVEEEDARVEPLIPEGTREETILVCEDDDDVRTYSVEVLRELGYRVLEAHDGPSALRLLERQEGDVDLLFTDVVLPSGMMGDKLAEAARALRPGLKVLFTTGYARNAIVHHGRLDPGVELITKPFTYADLAARIRDLLDQG